MGFVETVKILRQDDEKMRINFHVNSAPWKHRHVHDYWEVQVMLQGKFNNQINNTSRVLKTGEVQILRPDDVHYLSSASKGAYECLNLEIKKDVFKHTCDLLYPSLFQRLLAFEDHVPVFTFSDIALLKIRDLIVFAQQKVDITDDARQFQLMEVLLECLLTFTNQQFIHKETEEYSFTDTFIKMMKKSENIGLRLHDICKKFPCCVEYAIRRFKAEGKDSPNIVFRKIKLDYACGVLRTTEYSLETVASMIGFNNVGYFCELFEREIGMKATEYRKRYFRK